jgi:hypothetical protein
MLNKKIRGGITLIDSRVKLKKNQTFDKRNTHTHTHTHIYIYKNSKSKERG